MKCDTTASLALLLVYFTSNSVVADGYDDFVEEVDRRFRTGFGIVFGSFVGVVLLIVIYAICSHRLEQRRRMQRDVTNARERDSTLIQPPVQPPAVITYTGSPTEPAMPTSQTRLTVYSNVNCNNGCVPSYDETPPPYNVAIKAPAAPYYVGARAPPASTPQPPKY